MAAAEKAGDEEIIGIIAQNLGNLSLDRNQPEEAARHLQTAIAAFQRAGNERGQMAIFNSLGNVERGRDNLPAALAWFARSLETAERLGDIECQAMARSNRAIVFSTQAQRAADPAESRRFLNEAIAEERKSLVLKEQLGQPQGLAISHSNIADHLRRGGTHEAQSHAEEALAIFESIQDPAAWKTLGVLADIAAARGDMAAAAEYGRRKEAVPSEGQERSGTPAIPVGIAVALLQVALAARARGDTLLQALAAVGADGDLLATIDERAPWLSAHLRALAERQPRPAVDVPKTSAELLDQAWAAAGKSPSWSAGTCPRFSFVCVWEQQKAATGRRTPRASPPGHLASECRERPLTSILPLSIVQIPDDIERSRPDATENGDDYAGDALLATVSARGEERPVETQVVVYGATPAGVVAALAAARHGQSVALVEESRHVGGMMSGGLVATDIGDRATVGGLADEFFKRVSKYYRAGVRRTLAPSRAVPRRHQVRAARGRRAIPGDAPRAAAIGIWTAGIASARPRWSRGGSRGVEADEAGDGRERFAERCSSTPATRAT